MNGIINDYKRKSIMLNIIVNYVLLMCFYCCSHNLLATELNSSFIPEPIYFDLMRGLGAKQGELEVNSLTKVSKGLKPVISPEIEYAVFDNHALEFEFAIEDKIISELKLGYQFSFNKYYNYQHGLQFIYQFSTLEYAETYTAVYISGFRWGPRWSGLVMNGFEFFSGKNFLGAGALDQSDDLPIRRLFPRNIQSQRYIWNGNLFYDLNKNWIFGMELNLQTNFKREREVLILPNVSYHSSKIFSMQMGIGLNKELEANIYKPVLIMRMIGEF
jgi:hypothetical protein